MICEKKCWPASMKSVDSLLGSDRIYEWWRNRPTVYLAQRLWGVPITVFIALMQNEVLTQEIWIIW